MKKIISTICAVSVFALFGCAKSPSAISPNYISPLTYQNYNCNQLRAELIRVDDKLTALTKKQQHAHDKDSVALATGMVLFWPALFLMAGGDHKEEVASLKGQEEALETCAIQARCTDIIKAINETNTSK